MKEDNARQICDRLRNIRSNNLRIYGENLLDPGKKLFPGDGGHKVP